MRRRVFYAVILILIAVVAGAFYQFRPQTDMSKLVALALAPNSGTEYVAKVITTTDYNGKEIKTRATIYHQGVKEKVEYDGARGQTIWSIAKDDKTYTYLPKTKKLLISDQNGILSTSERSKLLSENYKSVSNGTEIIAGRPSYVVKITPKDGNGPSKKLWIDKQHLNILRSIDYDASGTERGSSETRKISYNAKIRPDAFDIAVNKSVERVKICESGRSADIFKKLLFRIAIPTYLPKGYRLEGYHLFYSQCNCHECSAQLTYIDGLNVISVFQSPKMTCCTTGSCNMAGCGKDSCAISDGDIAKTGHILRGNKIVVVVGDLLPNEIKKIAESVK